MTIDFPYSCVVDSTGNVYMAQWHNIFKISYPSLSSAVNVVGGTTSGSTDGSGTAAGFDGCEDGRHVGCALGVSDG